MTPSTLRFRARGTALCQHFEKLEARIKAFVGRKYKEVEPGVFGFAPTGEVETVPYRAEYVKACRDGDLWAADADTAKTCGVDFDPSFGADAPSPAAAPSAPAGRLDSLIADKLSAKPAEKG